MAIRKFIVLALIGSVVAVSSIWTIAQWLSDHGIVDGATKIREQFITGTAITVIVALLILLPDRIGSWHRGRRQRHQAGDGWPFD